MFRAFDRLSLFAARLAAVLAVAMWACAALAAEKAAGAPASVVLRSDESPENIRRILDALARDGREVTIRFASPKEPTTAAIDQKEIAPPAGLAQSMSATFIAGIQKILDGVALTPNLAVDFAAAWRNSASQGRGLPLLRLAGAFGLGLAALALVERLFFVRLNRPIPPVPGRMGERVRLSLPRLLVDLLAVAAYYAVTLVLLRRLLPPPDFIAAIGDNLLTATMGFFVYWVFGRFLLAPNQPGARIVPLPRAERHYRLTLIYGMVGPGALFLVAVASMAAHETLALVGLFGILGGVLTLYKLWWFWDVRRDMAALVRAGTKNPQKPGGLRRFAGSLASPMYMAVVVLLWAVAVYGEGLAQSAFLGGVVGLTQFIVVLTPLLAAGLSGLVASAHAAAREREGVSPLLAAVLRTIEAAAGGLVWVGGFLLIGRTWGPLMIDMGSPEVADTLRHLAVALGVGFVGWIAFVFASSFFQHVMPRSTAAVGDEETGTERTPSRLESVLPVLRGVTLGSILGLTALIFLSGLGVDISPLVAGFGILGLAISFGSQALVRDIVSGIFFMVEDAFRIGEYIDTGRLRGTVEKISLRSLQLRHSSGSIHTVPFGQIQSVTNGSRDWSTVKFNLRLDHSADIEQARKTIKKVGIALMEDPEYGPNFIAPLKMQGVAEITDAAVVVRLKFTAKPAQSSMMQREALKRVYRAFHSAGVPFASNAVTVRGDGDRLSAAASVGAEQQAVRLAAPIV